jgi:hypothetical protein
MEMLFTNTDKAENVCEDIICIDDVLFAGIVDGNCCLAEHKSAKSLVSAGLNEAERQLCTVDKFHHLLVKEFNTKLRSFSFIAIHKDYYLELVFPLLNSILCVFCNPEASGDVLSTRILELIARHDVGKNHTNSNPFEMWDC